MKVLGKARALSALGLGALLLLAMPGLGMADPPAPVAPTPKPAAQPDNPGTGDTETTAQSVDVQAKPVATISGQAKWADGFQTILEAETQLKAAAEKAGLKAVDHPLAVFTSTNDDGFSYQAMLPLAQAPAGKTELSDTVKLGMSPAGKALKFQHRGPYDDIDSTYDLITAYLDEKGLEAQDSFLEEYLTDLKTADDPSLAVDIYVFTK
ncbi:MAG TPA: GyrI-like domain-containing protein [Methylovirgula sp.]|jgi:effector-binding domain-containing protein